MEHRPRRLVGADLKRALQAQRRDPVLLGGEQPAGHEPHGQRRGRAIEDRSHRRRGALPAGRALEPAISDPPGAAVAAVGTDEPARPPQPLQVVQAVSVGPKPGVELAQRARIVLSGLGTGDRQSPVRLDGYHRAGIRAPLHAAKRAPPARLRAHPPAGPTSHREITNGATASCASRASSTRR